MFKPLWASFILLSSREKAIYLALLSTRAVAQLLDVAGLAAVGILGTMLANGLSNQVGGSFLGIEVPSLNGDQFLRVGLAVGALFILKSAASSILLRVTTRFLGRVEARASARVANWMFSANIDRIRSFSRGEIYWSVDGSSNVAFSNLLYSGSTLVSESALFVFVFVALLTVDTSTALVLSGYFFLIFLVFQLAVNARLKRIGQRISKNNIRISDTTFDLLDSFREALVLNKRDYFLEKLNLHRTEKALDSGLQRFLNGVPRFLVEIALIVGVIALVAWQFAVGNLRDGVVTTAVFIAGGFRIMAALLPLQSALSGIRAAGPQAEIAQDLLRKAREVHRAPELSHRELLGLKPREATLRTAISVKNLTYTHSESSRPALEELTFDVQPGQFVAIIGKSGAGKSTLADLLLGVRTPSAGEIKINGHDPAILRALTPGSLSYVPQKPGIVSGSVAQNVAFGVPEESIDSDRVLECLRKAELVDYVSQLGNGIWTSLGKQRDNLSGGQIQRLGLARALYSEPALLVLDEATSALDATTEAAIAKTVSSLGGTLTLLVIAHRLSTIRNADLVIALDSGKLAGKGTLDELRRDLDFVEEFIQNMRISDQD